MSAEGFGESVVKALQDDIRNNDDIVNAFYENLIAQDSDLRKFIKGFNMPIPSELDKLKNELIAIKQEIKEKDELEKEMKENNNNNKQLIKSLEETIKVIESNMSTLSQEQPLFSSGDFFKKISNIENTISNSTLKIGSTLQKLLNKYLKTANIIDSIQGKNIILQEREDEALSKVLYFRKIFFDIVNNTKSFYENGIKVAFDGSVVFVFEDVREEYNQIHTFDYKKFQENGTLSHRYKKIKKKLKGYVRKSIEVDSKSNLSLKKRYKMKVSKSQKDTGTFIERIKNLVKESTKFSEEQEKKDTIRTLETIALIRKLVINIQERFFLTHSYFKFGNFKRGLSFTWLGSDNPQEKNWWGQPSNDRIPVIAFYRAKKYYTIPLYQLGSVAEVSHYFALLAHQKEIQKLFIQNANISEGAAQKMNKYLFAEFEDGDLRPKPQVVARRKRSRQRYDFRTQIVRVQRQSKEHSQLEEAGEDNAFINFIFSKHGLLSVDNLSGQFLDDIQIRRSALLEEVAEMLGLAKKEEEDKDEIIIIGSKTSGASFFGVTSTIEFIEELRIFLDNYSNGRINNQTKEEIRIKKVIKDYLLKMIVKASQNMIRDLSNFLDKKASKIIP